MYVSACTHACECMYSCMRVHVFMYVSACIHVCEYSLRAACRHAHVCQCMYTCIIYVYLCVYIFRVHRHEAACAPPAGMHMYVSTCIHVNLDSSRHQKQIFLNMLIKYLGGNNFDSSRHLSRRSRRPQKSRHMRHF